MSFSEFERILKSLDNKMDSLALYSVFGEYLNSETTTTSVGHLSGNDIFLLICENVDADGDVGSSSSSKSKKSKFTKISESVLNSWASISVRTLRYNVILHMFNNSDLVKFKEVTHVELLLENSLYSIVMKIKICMRTFRKSGKKMKLDASTR